MSNRKFPLLEKAKAFLNLGDDGKMYSFWLKIEKDAKSKIKQLKANISKLDLDHEIALDKLNEQLEDAKEALEHAYINIDVKSIQTNTAQDDYLKTYLGNIAAKESVIERLEKNKESLIEAYNTTKEAYQNDIKKIEAKAAKILAEVK